MDWVIRRLETGFSFLFDREVIHKKIWLAASWLAVLLIGGAYLWGVFMSWGRFNYAFADWQQITGPRLAILKHAVMSWQLPLHISNTYTLFNVTDRFLAIPDQILSPQILLLRFMSIQTFVIIDILLLYTAGFLGLLWFMRRYSLSLIAFTVLFLLFNFNGHILAHYAVGHFTWGGYFLFPWFAALTIRLVEGEKGWGWVAKMALLLAALELQGSFHHFVWCLFFLGFLALTQRKTFLTVLGSLVFGVLVNMARLLPPALIYKQFDNSFLAGYQNLTDILNSLISILAPGEKTLVPMMTQPIQRWELTLYVGLVGAFFLFFFGVYRWITHIDRRSPYRLLLFPIAGTLLLSFDSIYRWVRALQIPLLDGERVASRIISLPFVFILLFAAIEFQRWLDQAMVKDRLWGYLTVVGLVIGAHDLWQNDKAWRILQIGPTFKQWGFNQKSYYLTNHSDPAYTNALWIGLGVSLTSLALVLLLAWLKRDKG